MAGEIGRAGRRAGGGAAPVTLVALGVGLAGAAWHAGVAPTDPAGIVRGSARLATGGRVTFAGTPPSGSPIDMSADAYCSGRHPEPVEDGPVRVGPEGGLADVLVYVREAPDGADAPAGGEVVLDQSGCLYAPAVVALRTGQTLIVRNSDETLHNVRVSPELARGFNIGQPLSGIESRRTFERPELGIPVRCDIHGWMHATIHVLDHGFFAVTGPDGAFELPALPPGEYTVEAWHRTLGTTTRRVTVRAGEATELSFELGA